MNFGLFTLLRHLKTMGSFEVGLNVLAYTVFRYSSHRFTYFSKLIGAKEWNMVFGILLGDVALLEWVWPC